MRQTESGDLGRGYTDITHAVISNRKFNKMQSSDQLVYVSNSDALATMAV